MKRIVLVLLSAGILLLTGCGKSEVNNVDNTSADSFYMDFKNNIVTESDKGYYFWECMNLDPGFSRLLFMDKESRQVVPLCNKPDCDHTTNECNAYYPEIETGKEWIEKRYLQYYQGNLYVIGCDEEGYVSLYMIKEDGSEWERSTQLFRADFATSGRWTDPEVLIAEGYIYFIDCGQENRKLERIKIEGKDSEIVYDGEDEAINSVYRMKEYGEYVYFQSLSFLEGDSENAVGGLYRCDAAGQCELVKEGLIGPYAIKEDKVYYGNEKGICCYSLTEETETVLNEEPQTIPDVTLTDDYIVLCYSDNCETILYDYEGNEIETVGASFDGMMYYGGDAENLFAEFCNAGEMDSWYILDTKKDNLSWEKL